MEDLTKQQLVLLTVFVSFVVSIATSILVLSLGDEDAIGVTQNISQIVERTIERVREVPIAVSDKLPPATTNRLAEVISDTVDGVVALTQDEVWCANGSVFKYQDRLWLATLSGLAETCQVAGETLGLKTVTATSSVNLFSITPHPQATTTRYALDLAEAVPKTGDLLIALSRGVTGESTALIGTLGNVVATSTVETFLPSAVVTDRTLGGPVLDEHGKLIGISVRPGFFVSSVYLRTIIDSVR